MTIQEVKDRVARKYDFDTWDKCISEAYMNSEFRGKYGTDPHKLFDEVADLYARAKWYEACDEQKEIIKGYVDIDDVPAIIDAPKPEFKP